MDDDELLTDHIVARHFLVGFEKIRNNDRKYEMSVVVDVVVFPVGERAQTPSSHLRRNRINRKLRVLSLYEAHLK